MKCIEHTKCKEIERISAHADGVIAPGSAHAKPSARPPISMSGTFSEHMSAESPSKKDRLT